jgi:flagellar basal-body rod modification protein FlgD
MSQVPSVGNTPPSSENVSSSKFENNDALRGLGMDDFLKLMITQMQNQDPLDPMSNSEMLQQISQIRSIGATAELSETLGAVLLGQNISSATNLIGKRISARTDAGEEVQGLVDRISISDGVPKIRVDEHTISLNNIREIITPDENDESNDE